MSGLAECPGCQRHVRVTESACPFCGVGITLSAPTFTTSAARLSRAALLVALTACEGTQSRDVYGGPPQTVYGGPPVDRDAGALAVPDAGKPDAAAPAPPVTIERTIYGGPPVPQPKTDPPIK